MLSKFGYLKAPLFLGKLCGVVTYFFLQKKRKRKNKYNYIFKILQMSLIEYENVQFGGLTLQGFGPSYNLCKKKIQSFGPSYILPK